MAMATPAPLSISRNKSNDYLVQGAPAIDPAYPPAASGTQHRRQLKSSKSVDNIAGRARSHTADAAVHGLRSHFHHLYIDSPSLTRAQLDAYGGMSSPSVDNNNSNGSVPTTTLHRTGSGNSSGNSSTNGPDQDEYPNHHHYQQRHRQQRPPPPQHQHQHQMHLNQNGDQQYWQPSNQQQQHQQQQQQQQYYHQQDQKHYQQETQQQPMSPNYQPATSGQQWPYPSGASGSSSVGAGGQGGGGGGGGGGGLQVQANHVASRSTPKLTLYSQTPTTQHQLIKESSKETRSFNGTPTAHLGDSKPKAKSSSRLKPIVTAENTNEDHVERDQYGFKKESQWLSHHEFVVFETYYIPIMERRRQKWAIFMNDSHGQLPPRSAKLKRYIRKGIPPALRGEAWFHYSGAEDKCKANPGVFKKLVALAKAKGSANEHAEVIERDLHRTFPENINFKSQITQQNDGGSQLSTENVPAIQSLRRVLLAFSLHCPTIGYCQSLNYIAGMLLLFMNEEHSFWTLTVIIQNFLPEGMYDVTMEGANIDQAVLMTLVMERLPNIWTKFSNGATSVEMDEGGGLPTVTLVTSHWFLTLFINILPVESILRVWDCFFYEGRKILFRMALTILRLHEAEISKIDDPLEVFQVVQNIPKRLIDCHKLMEACFKRMGSFDLTTRDIDRRYEQFRAKRKAARANTASSRK
ncbi:hypothetical protein BGZ94_006966 [Podila epigama]|nr:hypothetical protein BGZ94_006966 [Podila epigama]